MVVDERQGNTQSTARAEGAVKEPPTGPRASSGGSQPVRTATRARIYIPLTPFHSASDALRCFTFPWPTYPA